MKVIVTGCAGFIGMHLCARLLKDEFEVYGIDNLNTYYSVQLKKDRLENLRGFKHFNFNRDDITNSNKMYSLFRKIKPDIVVNLAAQAGVRYSLINPHEYIKSNIMGFMNILEACRQNNVRGLIYASSSSVYGANKKELQSINDRVSSPISIYSVSKISNELMANSYNHLYGLRTTGLRFFTAYGPWGRPDMALYIFVDRILKGEKVPIFNYGRMERDFTYIDDIIDGICSAINKNYDCEIFNLGNNHTTNILDMIKIIEKELNLKADINFLEKQLGDVEKTCADIEISKKSLGYDPKISLENGISNFIDWFMNYYKRDKKS